MSTLSDRVRLILAHASVWLIWGSTYLAIRFAIETMPPFAMSGARFLVAGLLVLVVLHWRGVAWPNAAEWRAALIIGTMLVAAGNGAVAWTELTVPSGLVALTVALMPAWMVLFDWLGGAARPRPVTLAGLAVGFVGVAILMGPEAVSGSGAIPLRGALTVMAGSMSWALGSIYARSAPKPASGMMATAAQMICGGGVLLFLGAVVGETAHFSMSDVSRTSLLAWIYLVIAGSIVAYSGYVYLLHNTEPAKAGSYAFVNPVIAVVLGWALGGEALTPRVGLAAALIVCAVALIVRNRRRPT
jgi:drug/metabolite transporter (DMT)-like permease